VYVRAIGEITYKLYCWVIRCVYALIHLSPARDRIVFLSRQATIPSLDFTLLADELRGRFPDWQILFSCYRDSGSFLKRVVGTLKHLRYVARSRICIVDGYSPAVSVPNLDPQLVVIQLWHALGAIKKFGWQSVGTPAGRTPAQAEIFAMHRNYTAVIASGAGAQAAYADAFGYPLERITPLGLPRMDYLLDNDPRGGREQIKELLLAQYPELHEEGVLTLLWIPTFDRAKSATEQTRQEELQKLRSALDEQFIVDAQDTPRFRIIVSRHPFDQDTQNDADEDTRDAQENILCIPKIKTIDLLGFADYVIADYSSAALAAALLRKKVLFYTPDIDDYRISPGLNIDPEVEFPSITFRTPHDLTAFIEQDLAAERYQHSGFWQYCERYFAHEAMDFTTPITSQIANFILASMDA